jgi:phage shock protein A
MAQLIRSRHDRIVARITALEAQLAALDAALLTASASDTLEYRFDSGEGSQRKEFRSVKEMQEEQTYLENRLEFYYAKLEGTGLVNMRLRRHI